jgi:hypothetical protein
MNEKQAQQTGSKNRRACFVSVTTNGGDAASDGDATDGDAIDDDAIDDDASDASGDGGASGLQSSSDP